MFKKLLILQGLLIFAACGEAPDTGRKHVDYQKIKEDAQARKRNFNPGFVTASHEARLFRIKDYEICDTVTTLKRDTVPVLRTVAGDLPQKNAPGPFTVTFLSEKGETLYQYGMRSPRFARREHGPDKGLYKVKDGTFLVPIPPLENAAKIVLRDSDGVQYESKLRVH